MIILFADVIFCEILTQTSIAFHGHQSSNWFNNSVILPPIPNDLDKYNPKNILFILVSSHSALPSDKWESHPMLILVNFIEIILHVCLEYFFAMIPLSLSDHSTKIIFMTPPQIICEKFGSYVHMLGLSSGSGVSSHYCQHTII